MEVAFILIHGIIRTDAADAPAATPAPALPAALTAMDCTTLPKASKQESRFNYIVTGNQQTKYCSTCTYCCCVFVLPWDPPPPSPLLTAPLVTDPPASIPASTTV